MLSVGWAAWVCDGGRKRVQCSSVEEDLEFLDHKQSRTQYHAVGKRLKQSGRSSKVI